MGRSEAGLVTAENLRVRHFLVDGMDLAGKTTVVDQFAADQAAMGVTWDKRYSVISKPDARGRSSGVALRAAAEQMARSGSYRPDTVGLVVLGALAADIDEYEPPEIPTVQESSTLLRSMSYFAINGHTRELQMIRELGERHPQFDATFVLTASREARLERLAYAENPSKSDLLVRDNPGKFFRQEELLVEGAQEFFGAVVIDTSDMSIQEVARTIGAGIMNLPGETTVL